MGVKESRGGSRQERQQAGGQDRQERCVEER
jgi:hypothetical protein